MRPNLSIPLVGAALLTLGALALRLTLAGAPMARKPAVPDLSPRPLLDRLRERGF